MTGVPVSSRQEGDARVCPCGKNQKRAELTFVGQHEMYKEERHVLEEMRKVDECDMEKFSTRDTSERAIATLGDSGHKRRY